MSTFNLNNFNSFLDKATQAISCDSDCQNQNTKQELKDKYLNAQSNLTLAEPEFEVAKKNYYTYISGQSGYNVMIEKELEQKANLIVETLKKNYQDDVSKIKTQINTYNGLLINYNNVVDLYKKYKTENVKLYNQLKNDTNDILTNERKTYYEDQQNDALNSYYYYILWVIYIIVVLCLIIFSLIYPSQSNFKMNMMIILLFIVLPFISSWILGKIIYIFYWLFSMLPKNVYV